MNRKFKFLVLTFFIFTLHNFSQNEEHKWAVSLGSGAVIYSVENAPAVGGRYIPQFPRVSVAKYMFKNVTFVGSISGTFRDSQKYTTLDGEARYDFGTSKNTINPYVVIGGSFVKSKHFLPTLNFGIGGTLWISNHFGLHGQLLHKYNDKKFNSQRSHTFLSAGLVYRFSLFGGRNGTNGGFNRKRLWD
ncbi:hypothetical protein [Polaribacter staleyi]|uniref:hypothetical protein n=1 Tax=Polaribacter staleyi TaxID=2022337 RepID=UPI0031BA5A1A